MPYSANTQQSKLAALKARLRELSADGAALACAADANSELLLFLLKELRKESAFPLLALAARSIFQAEDELADLQKTAASFGVELKIIACDPLAVPEVKYNPPDRCYWCRRYLLSEMRVCAQNRGIPIVLASADADERRNGKTVFSAFSELGVFVPLAELEVTRRDVREMAAALALKNACGTAATCMATRFECGALLTDRIVQTAIAGEDLVRRLLPRDAEVRLQIHGPIGRLEISERHLNLALAHRGEITCALKKLGLSFVTLDMGGHVKTSPAFPESQPYREN